MSPNPTSPGMLKPLAANDWIEDETVIGLYSGSETESTSAMDVPSRDSLLQGVRLMAPRPGGAIVADAALSRRISDELGQQLGGWFAQDLTPYLQLHDSLLSREERDRFRQGGMTIPEENTKTAYYSLAFEKDGWRVQGIGELGVFHAVSLGRPLTQAEALGAGGHVIPRPLGSVESVISGAAPKIATRNLADRSGEHAPNVFDTYLVDQQVKVKGGVRMRLARGGEASSDVAPYFYGIRINMDLR